VEQDFAQRARKVLQDLVDTVGCTGGVEKDDHGLYCPVADPEWVDLGCVYLDACDVLGVEPKVEEP
jgi:hypothetical protein